MGSQKIVRREPGPAASLDLDRSLASGIVWTGATKWASQLFNWAATLVVARILTPADYGLVGMAAIYMGLVTLVSEFGLGTAIVTLRELSAGQVQQINGLAILLGLGYFAVSCAMALPLGNFFNAPQLPLVVVVLGTTLIVSAFRVVPYALLQRELRFKLLGLLEGGQAVLLAVTTLLFAVAGLGYWALIFGSVTSTIVLTAATVAYRPTSFAWPRVDALRSTITFSWHVIVGRLSWYAYSNSDFLVAGRVLGAAPLGAYTFAWSLASIPVDKVTALVTRVTPAFFSAVQADPGQLRRYLLSLTEGLALITLPVTVGMALVAEDFILFALGERWRGAILPLQLLGVYAAFRSVVTLLPQILIVRGEARFAMWNGVMLALTLPGAFYVGSRWGVGGIAAVWLAVYPLLTVPLYWKVFRTIELGLGDYLKAVWPALNAVLLMTIAVLAMQQTLPPGYPIVARLGLQVSCGAAVFLLALALLHRQRIRTAVATVRLLRE